MYFDLNDDQKAIRDAVGNVLHDFLPTDRLVPSFDAGTLDPKLWHSLTELGLTGILVPATSGGSELDLVTLADVAEHLGYAGAAAPVVPNALAAWLIAIGGDGRQRARWLPGLLSGETIASFAFCELDGNVLPEDSTMTGPGISGRKQLVEWGEQAHLIIASTSGDQLALIDASAQGVTRTGTDSVDRTRPLADIDFDRVEIDPLLGDAECSEDLVERLRDAWLVASAAGAYGAAQRALDMAVEYARERKQFDQPIGAFQGIKHQIANAYAELLPSRQLVWYAAHAWDALPDRRAHAAALAKAHVTDIAVRVARLTVELHGGIGYTWEYPLHIFLKRAMYERAYLGLPTRHRQRAANLAKW